MNQKLFSDRSNVKRYVLTLLGILLLAAIISIYSLAFVEGGFSSHENISAVVSLWVVCSVILYLMYHFVIFVDRFTYSINNLLFLFSAVLIPVFISIASAAIVSTYALPIMLTSLLVTTMSKKRYAFMASVVSGLIYLLCYLMIALLNDENAFVAALPTVVAIAMNFIISFIIKEDYTRLKIVGTALVVGAVGAVVGMVAVLISDFNGMQIIVAGVWSLAGYFFAVLMYVFLSPILEWIFKLPTNLNLLELADFSNPLLKELAEKAPGTYSHSLAIGSLAEQCAYAIGENAVLAKVAGYYHDIGKIEKPEYYVENQEGGKNPHDNLPFDTSVNMITRHTQAGYDLLRKKGFPEEIAKIARTHHGNSILKYFYLKAKSITEGEVDSAAFRYPNPRPQTRIAGIIMICDAAEAATRAVKPASRDEMVKKINEIVQDKLDENQFDECPLTIKDLATIKNTLADVLEGTIHNRIAYPEKR